MIAFAANSVLTRLGIAAGLISVEAFATLRVLSGAIMLSALVLGAGGRLRGRPNVWAVAGLALYMIGFTFAYLRLDAGLGALVLFGVVQISMFAGALLAREAVPFGRWVGMGLALAGLALISNLSGAQAADHIAFGFMSLAGLGWGVYSLIGRGVSDPLQATALNFLWATPVVIAATLLVPFSETPHHVTSWGAATAILSGAVTSGLGYALWYRVLPALSASLAAVAQLSVPILALIAGNLTLGERVSGQLLAAACLVLGGIGLAVLSKQPKQE